jgi:hypothetical protein
MIIAPLVNLASGFLDSLIPTNTSTKTTPSGTAQGANASSPFAQLLSSLEQLEQSSLSSSYQQVTKQISDFTNAASSLNL